MEPVQTSVLPPDLRPTGGEAAQGTPQRGVPTLDDAGLQGLFAALKVVPHPMLSLPTLEGVQTLMAVKPATWKAELAGMLNKRQLRIRQAEEDPLWFGWELEPWGVTDELMAGTYVAPAGGWGGRDAHAPSSGLRPPSPVPTVEGPYKPAAADVVGIFGGNRASKTVYSVRRALQNAVLCEKTVTPIMSESEPASVATVQKLAWWYLQPHYGHLNGKRDAVFKINYSQANGFTDRKLVLPNGSEIWFLTYNQEVGDYEGWEFGAPAVVYARVAAEMLKAGKFMPANIGAVADESLPLSWLKMYSRRLKFRKAKLLWSFTPVKGITPAVKEMVGTSAVTIEHRAAELLPRKNFPDLPPGRMPFVRECVFPGIKAMAIYFFTLFNKFGPSPERTYYQEVQQLCEGKASEYVERIAYGMARDSVNRGFKKFGAVNMVKRSQLPAVGTNYFITDPAGKRNWASMWVRVTPNGEHFIYRDWPDAQTYGEWAVPTEREVNDTSTAGWDGDAGPAQNGLGFGIVKYKQTWLEKEKIKRIGHLSPALSPSGEGDRGAIRVENIDPYHAKMLRQGSLDAQTGELYEEITERYVDPRAGASEHMAEKGGTCIIDEFDEVQVDSQGKVIGPSMELIPASGVNEDEGLSLVNDLLDWNDEVPLCPVINQPHLFVSEDAMQVKWCLENFTGKGGAKGACKDFADLLRYMALAKLAYVDNTKAHGKAGGGF